MSWKQVKLGTVLPKCSCGFSYVSMRYGDTHIIAECQSCGAKWVWHGEEGQKFPEEAKNV